MSRTLFLMRHGDYDRTTGNLSRKGIDQAHSIAEQLLRANIQPDLILHSPLPRAQQTAAAIADAYKMVGRGITTMRVENKLADKAEVIDDALTWLTDEKVILAVSHEPQICHAMDALLGNKQWRSHHAGVAVIESDDWEGIFRSGSGRFLREYAPKNVPAS